MQASLQLVNQEVSSYFGLSRKFNGSAHLAQLESPAINKVIAIDPSKPLIADNSIKQMPYLGFMVNLVERMSKAILPIESLVKAHPEFVRSIQCWLTKAWCTTYRQKTKGEEVCAVLQFIARVFTTYDSNAGGRFEEFIKNITKTFQNEVKSFVEDSHDSELLLTSIMELYRRFESSTEITKRHVILKETGLAEAADLRRQAEELFLDEVAGRTVPHWAYDFISELWISLFQANLDIKRPAKSLNWAVSLLHELLKSFKSHNDDDFANDCVNSEFSWLRENIAALTQEFEEHQGSLNKFLMQLKVFHENLSQGVKTNIHWSTFPSSASLRGKSLEASESEQRMVMAKFKPGMWLRYRANEKHRFCRVAFRETKLSLIVLVNFSGEKVASFNFEQLNHALEEQAFQFISLHSDLNATVTKISKEVALCREKLEGKLEAAKLDKKRRDEEQTARQEESKLQAFQAHNVLLSETKDVIQTLSPGARFSYSELPGQVIRFMLKLKVSGKYVFSDLQGRKIADWHENELAEKLASGDLKIIDNKMSTLARERETSLEQLVSVQRMQKAGVS
ncbi:MAG: DUF1631 family protein [Gammaproteobacteria bacterium]|nr:DUF1631 family protein [Gammaproteobacteria bacterium]